MAALSLRGRPVETVFDLLGRKEDYMTYSLGWCLTQAPAFLDALCARLGTARNGVEATVGLQDHGAGTGFTDVRIDLPGKATWIIEAKRGFTVPTREQLEKYARRLHADDTATGEKALVVLAESDRAGAWLRDNTPAEVLGLPVRALSWRELQRLAGQAAQAESHAGKRLLRQFIGYLGNAVQMQDIYSNWVYVVSLSRDNFGGETTFVDVVETHGKYFHPVGGQGRGGWPVEPPNYIAFRYDGGLQSIHHVDDYTVIVDFGPHFPGQPSEKVAPHYLYTLGPAIRPPKRTPTGPGIRMANRVWCLLDTLLTSETITDAKKATDERVAERETA